MSSAAPFPSYFILPGDPLDPAVGLSAPRANWGAQPIPGDTKGRWLLHTSFDSDFWSVRFSVQPGVIPLPHVLSAKPLSPEAVDALGVFGVQAGDRTFDALQKIVQAGHPGAVPQGLRCPTTTVPPAILSTWLSLPLPADASDAERLADARAQAGAKEKGLP